MENKEKEEFNNYKLKLRQALDLESKELLTAKRIREWYNYCNGKVYVPFSGGMDSLVVLHNVRRQFPNVTGVFADTGLEYPEIRDFVKTIDNVIWVKPVKTFKQVIQDLGFPIVSKNIAYYTEQVRKLKSEDKKNTPTYKLRMEGVKINGEKASSRSVLSKKWHKLVDAPFKISAKCCDVIKKEPLKKYAKESNSYPIMGLMAEEGGSRENSYIKNGCNVYDSNDPQCRPIMFWKKSDVWDYVHKYNISYSKIYDMGEKRTGCMFCMFGIHLEKGENRFQRMYKTHPKQWKYCMENLGIQEVMDFLGLPTKPNKNEMSQVDLFNN